MKRQKHLFEQVASLENLLGAAKDSLRGKRSQQPGAGFLLELENELVSLHEELTRGEYAPGAYHYFTIYEPKQRRVAAAPFRGEERGGSPFSWAEPSLPSGHRSSGAAGAWMARFTPSDWMLYGTAATPGPFSFYGMSGVLTVVPKPTAFELSLIGFGWAGFVARRKTFSLHHQHPANHS